jgi:hypothetical protein
MDVISSMKEHLTRETLAKMLSWSKDGVYSPELWFIGSRGINHDGKVYIDGQESHCDSNAFLGMVRSWQRRGGLWMDFVNDSEATRWCDYLIRTIQDVPNEVVVTPHQKQELIMPDDEKNFPGLSVLMSFSGIGYDRAKAIYQYCGNLHLSLVFIGNPEYWQYASRHILGVGIATLQKAHDQMGLPEGTVLDVDKVGGGDSANKVWWGYPKSMPGEKSPFDIVDVMPF